MVATLPSILEETRSAHVPRSSSTSSILSSSAPALTETVMRCSMPCRPWADKDEQLHHVPYLTFIFQIKKTCTDSTLACDVVLPLLDDAHELRPDRFYLLEDRRILDIICSHFRSAVRRCPTRIMRPSWIQVSISRAPRVQTGATGDRSQLTARLSVSLINSSIRSQKNQRIPLCMTGSLDIPSGWTSLPPILPS